MSPSIPSVLQAPLSILTHFGLGPEQLQEAQQRFVSSMQDLMHQVQTQDLPIINDKRFSAVAWQDNSSSQWMAQAYLNASTIFKDLVSQVQAPPDIKQRLEFLTAQWLDAMAPSNFIALNPDAQKSFIESQGQSLVAGIQNMLQDLQQGRITNTDESQFVVGQNLATTPGAVIYENRFFQLIQYASQTSKVYERPLLMVPPCINKFYILDLQAHNSFVRHAVEQGFTVFLMSWRNPIASDGDGILEATWDEYIEQAVINAIKIVQRVSRQSQINALGFCVGGTLLSTALAVLKSRGEAPIASLTLLTTFLDFSDPGVLGVFVNEAHVQLREYLLGQGGLLTAGELANTFAFLRPNDLVWNYVVDNYLKGNTPAPFDLLFWNADSTNVPGPFYVWYLRHTYLENSLKIPGALSTAGQPVNLGLLDMPAYVYASKDDHIVPWNASYLSAALLQGDTRFVLGASGHIAGVINPPKAKKRHYWTRQESSYPQESEKWFEQTQRVEGSWWPDWYEWLSKYSGRQIKAKRTLGNKMYSEVEPAPGRYVLVRAI